MCHIAGFGVVDDRRHVGYLDARRDISMLSVGDGDDNHRNHRRIGCWPARGSGGDGTGGPAGDLARSTGASSRPAPRRCGLGGYSEQRCDLRYPSADAGDRRLELVGDHCGHADRFDCEAHR